MKPQLALLATLLVAVLLIGAGEPFVQEGTITYTLVADTPEDIIHGAQIASQLQSYATQTPDRLAATPEQVSAVDAPFISIGTPANNALTADLLEEQQPRGAYLGFAGQHFLITGTNAQEVQEATNAFLQGTRSLGALHTPTPTHVPEETTPTILDENNQTTTTNTTTTPSTTTNATSNQTTAQECEERTYCDGNTLQEQQANCSTQRVEYCAHGCSDGACKQGFFTRIWNAVAFWR